MRRRPCPRAILAPSLARLGARFLVGVVTTWLILALAGPQTSPAASPQVRHPSAAEPPPAPPIDPQPTTATTPTEASAEVPETVPTPTEPPAPPPTEPGLDHPPPGPPVAAQQICIELIIEIHLPGVGIHIRIICHHPPPPEPPPTTTTTTTTTTEPPPPNTTTTTEPPPETTTTTTTEPPPPPPDITTTTTTAPPPPPARSPTPRPPSEPPPTTTTEPPAQPEPVPPPSEPLPPRLTVAVTLNPSLPTAGDLVTATIVVRNQGEGPAEDAGLVDEVSRSAAVRSASGPRGGTCDVSSRRAACELGTIEPGRSVTATVRFLLAREPASSTLTQRITLTGSGDAAVAERGVSTLIDQEQAGAVPFDSLGTPVLLVAVVAFVLAARGRSG